MTNKITMNEYIKLLENSNRYEKREIEFTSLKILNPNNIVEDRNPTRSYYNQRKIECGLRYSIDFLQRYDVEKHLGLFKNNKGLIYLEQMFDINLKEFKLGQTGKFGFIVKNELAPKLEDLISKKIEESKFLELI